MTDRARAPQSASFYNSEEQVQHDTLTRRHLRALRSSDRAARLAVVTDGPLSARLLEEALSGPDDVRQAAFEHQRLAGSHVDYYLNNGKRKDRLLVVRHQQLDTVQVDTALADSTDEVRQAAVTHQRLTEAQVGVALADPNRDVRLATLEHQHVVDEQVLVVLANGNAAERAVLARTQSLSGLHVDALLSDPDPKVRVQAAQHQTLAVEQVDRLLAIDPSTTDSNARELRRAAIDCAAPHQLGEHTADADPVVAERARELMGGLAEKLRGSFEVPTPGTEAARTEQDSWERAGERELQAEAARAAALEERDGRWWMDRAWVERNELMERIPGKPQGPEAQVARAEAERDALSAQLRSWEQSARALPAGQQDVFATSIDSARQRLQDADTSLAVARAAIEAGTHPQVIARRQWELENGADLSRLEDLNRDCATHLRQLALTDGKVPPAPETAVGQAIWLQTHGDYAALEAKFERTGRYTREDVDLQIQLRSAAQERAASYGRYGYDGSAALEVDAEERELDVQRRHAGRGLF